jgi:hypothetical protein
MIMLDQRSDGSSEVPGTSLLEGVDTPIFSEIRPRPSFRT